MPKFKVSVGETVVSYYADVEVEAATAEDAILKAETMAMNGELEEGRVRSNWHSEAEELKPG